MESLNPLLRKKLLKTLSKWCQKSHNSQVKYFLCQILIQMRQSEDDILKRFSVLQLKKLDTKNDEMFTYARKCPSADIVTRINIRLIWTTNFYDKSALDLRTSWTLETQIFYKESYWHNTLTLHLPRNQKVNQNCQLS